MTLVTAPRPIGRGFSTSAAATDSVPDLREPPWAETDSSSTFSFQNTLVLDVQRCADVPAVECATAGTLPRPGAQRHGIHLVMA